MIRKALFSQLKSREVWTIFIGAAVFVAGSFLCAAHEHRDVAPPQRTTAPARLEEISPRLPPPSVGVTDLKFSDFFAYPVGDRGLELTPKFRDLDGKRIRIAGFMVRQGKPVAGMFLLTPMPAQTHEEEYGLCDDLPPATLHVFVSTRSNEVAPYTPGLLLLTGTLTVGNRTEEDGRNSFARLLLDPPTTTKKPSLREQNKGAHKLMGPPKK